MQFFWQGFEKRAGWFNWGKPVAQAAEAAAKKPGLMETVKAVAGDVADISGKIKDHISSEEAKKVVSNVSSMSEDLKKTFKILRWPLVGLTAATTAGSLATIPGKLREGDLKKEQLKYYRSMNQKQQAK